MERVFEILHRINSAYLTEEDIKAQSAGIEIDPSDFDGPMDVIPVSDPAIFSETQRFAQIQAVMQRAATVPQLYDARKVEDMFLRTLKISDTDVLQPKPASEDMDPVSENVAATMGSPVYVLPAQDHIAHLMTHLAFLKSPLFGQNPAIIKTYLYPMAIHLRDHLLNYYLTEAHEAVDKAQKEKLIEEDSEQQVSVILEVQRYIENQLATFANELAQIDKQAQQFKPEPPMPPDSSLQVAKMSAELQGQALQQKAQADQARLQIEQQKLVEKQKADQQKMTSDQMSSQAELQREQLRQQSEDQRTMAELQARMEMNTDDNETAMRLAAAEIASGDKVAVSTGTGINPGV
jgi:hypothetical protein